MKTNLLLLTCMICAMFCGRMGNAQTTLAVGDVAIIMNRANAPDDFAFVTFVDLDANTFIYFTDCGADVNGFAPNYTGSEGVFLYIVPASGHIAGDIIRYNGGANANFSSPNNARFTGAVGLASSGDQILVFQESGEPGGSPNFGDNPVFIFASNNASSAFTGDKTDSNQTGLPVGLQDTTAPLTAMGFGTGSGPEDHIDNSIYNGTYTFNNMAEAKLALTNLANYYTIDNIQAGGANEGDATYTSADAAIPAALTITLSNDEFSLDNGVSVFPNPSNGNVTIKNAGIALKKATISDINGRVISTVNLNGVTNDKNLDLGSVLSTGIYFMNISSENASTVKKLVIE